MTGSFRPIKAAVCILEHNGVPACITGDLAYLYYNLNNPYPWSEDEEWPGHEHQRDFPRVRTTNWTNPPHEIVIFPASAYGLDFPDGSVVISLADFGTRPNISQYLAQRPLDRFEFTRMIVPPPLPLPRLPPLIKGLAKTYLRTEDSAQSNEGELCLGYIDNLIHSMNLDKAWYNSIKDEDSAVVAVVSDLVRGKGEWTKWPRITRSIEKKEEAEHVRLIPGYE
ncbi:hypothetical protein QBC46DRAFT_270545 [Diplogelasinospora grovesii]|uniref:Uncharacterized protein n=1 Tax=Diplogelasinospora grovesii TaxID=303347 RepID=A0AAN6MYZ7_9PEZI|nr:hypothetical protein QBC46DRAFT_270545 [Diplogelasinospora grovesii]